MKKLLAGVLSAAVAVSMIGPAQITFAAEDENTFTIALNSDIVALDPAFAYDFTTNPVVNQITQGLLTVNENNEL